MRNRKRIPTAKEVLDATKDVATRFDPINDLYIIAAEITAVAGGKVKILRDDERSSPPANSKAFKFIVPFTSAPVAGQKVVYLNLPGMGEGVVARLGTTADVSELRSITSAVVNGSGDLIITYSDATTQNAGHVVGAQGVPGVQGEQGEQGIQGIQGVPGEQGEQGIQGVPGEQGIQGIQGIQGEQGIQGIQGEPGICEPCFCDPCF